MPARLDIHTTTTHHSPPILLSSFHYFSLSAFTIMKPRRSSSCLPFPALIPSVFTFAAGLQAATITKAATGIDLTDGASWGGTPPGSIDIAATGSTLTWTAVPEPSSALVGLLIGAGLFRRRSA